MHVFVVEVIPEAGVGRIGQEAYTTLEKAQAFIESRSDHPVKQTEYIYRTTDFTDYIIWDCQVV